jgi:metal-sulfur cluster biosynthetic enzyme
MVNEQDILNKLRGVYDPEVPVNIVDLGLIYGIDISEEGKVDITMTLTSAFCPAGDMIVSDVTGAAYAAGASGVDVNVTFQPEWGPDKISDEGKLELGLF